MVESAMDARLLDGEQVAFTGRLASMTRAEAAKLVSACGAQFSRRLTRQTSLLVIGEEGWPLQSNGRLTRKLRLARQLQRTGRTIQILSEQELLDRLGFDGRNNGLHRLHTVAELARILQLRRDRIRQWMRAGLIRPVETQHGISRFDFRQVSGAKTLCDLMEAGITADRIRRSLVQLRRWMPEVDQPLEQLAMLERDGRLLVRLDDGNLAEPTGQLHIEFSADACDAPTAGHIPIHRAVQRTADECFLLGVEQERAGRFGDAIRSYREALLAGGPDPDICFNLANTLYRLGHKEAAVERFRQAVEIDREFVEAWNNLGNALVDLDQHEDAVVAYRRALELDADYVEAHYNLADTLDQLGRDREAEPHWRAYLLKDPAGSPWAEHARRRLGALR